MVQNCIVCLYLQWQNSYSTYHGDTPQAIDMSGTTLYIDLKNMKFGKAMISIRWIGIICLSCINKNKKGKPLLYIVYVEIRIQHVTIQRSDKESGQQECVSNILFISTRVHGVERKRGMYVFQIPSFYRYFW